MTPKHSLKANASSSATQKALSRVRVPFGQSWAAVYWELQAQSIEVAIDRRLKLFAVREGLPERSAIESSERLRRIRAMFRQSKWILICVLGGLVLVLMFLLTATNFPSVGLRERPTQATSNVEAKPLVAKKQKCLVSKEQAETAALIRDKWNKLGGVGYTHVTLRCSGKVADYQIVKNLISGSIVSTKEVG